MITFCGTHVTKEFGAPNLRDIAVQSMRLVRFCGSAGKWFPIGMHLLLTADLLPPELEHHGLLHDAPEVVVNDTPRPMKTKAQRALEHRVQKRIYHSLGLRMPTPEEEALIHAADIRAVNVEGVLDYGPRGFEDLQPGLTADPVAMKKIQDYLSCFNPLDALNPDGYWPLRLERRLRKAIRKAQQNISPDVSYTSPA
ncbi:hypothetical protein [uncultured Paludibaculum sp.]|uniref:hypothetical protein n=1 Tax=uncultured Paludibaculum sp. TaxID=1765020 RepID=UPI002AABBC90|nr:hypothetical protein [uncultured Paludibaculum sp.]